MQQQTEVPRPREHQRQYRPSLPGQRQHRRAKRLRQLSRLILFAAGLAAVAFADTQLPHELEGIGVDEHLGKPVDLNLQFTAENGYQVPLSQYFHQGKPVILDLVYYQCPMLCNLVLNGQTKVMKELPWTAGNEFEVVTISINPRESTDLAKDKKATYLESYGRQTTGWHFLTDYNGNAKRLADQIGFHYRWDERGQQYIHSAAIMILTPDGKISRYLYGIRFTPRDVRFALTEASEYRLSNTVAKVVLYCFHYDPAARGYVIVAENVMKLGGIVAILGMATMIALFLRQERRQKKAAEALQTKVV